MIKLSDNLKYDKTLLKNEFEKAKEDDDFKNFINRLSCSDELLMKYTSYLKESSIEYNNCLNCKGLSECKNSLLGHAYLPKISNIISFNYKKCHYKKNQDSKYNYEKNIIYYNVTKENRLAEFSKIDKRIKGRQDAILYLNNFLNNYENTLGLYLYGSTGCGKTYMVTSVINELAKKNIKCAIAFWPDFLRNLKSSFDTDYEDKINYLINVEVLFIDDLGGESLTPWARDEVLFPILQGRLDKDKKTFITSNLDKELLYEHLSLTKQGVEKVKAERIVSRINAITNEVSMICKDYRIKKEN